MSSRRRRLIPALLIVLVALALWGWGLRQAETGRVLAEQSVAAMLNEARAGQRPSSSLVPDPIVREALASVLREIEGEPASSTSITIETGDFDGADGATHHARIERDGAAWLELRLIVRQEQCRVIGYRRPGAP